MSDVKELNINNTTYDIKAKTVVDNNGTKLSMWSGTKQEYDNIATKDPNQLYFIEDDTDTTLSLLELLYPVGSIYIGTMATCPLQVLGVGTWQLVASDRVLQGAGTRGSVGSTVEAGLPNITGEFFYRGGGSTTYTEGGFSQKDGQATGQSHATGYADNTKTIVFDASRSSSIYGNSSTVQAPAYIVNIWERIS